MRDFSIGNLTDIAPAKKYIAVFHHPLVDRNLDGHAGIAHSAVNESDPKHVFFHLENDASVSSDPPDRAGFVFCDDSMFSRCNIDEALGYIATLASRQFELKIQTRDLDMKIVNARAKLDALEKQIQQCAGNAKMAATMASAQGKHSALAAEIDRNVAEFSKKMSEQFRYAPHYSEATEIVNMVTLYKDGCFGLSCATVILVIFRHLGLKLIAIDAWPTEDHSKYLQETVLPLLRRKFEKKKYHQEEKNRVAAHIEAVSRTTNFKHVIPTQVVGACMAHSGSPVSMIDANSSANTVWSKWSKAEPVRTLGMELEGPST